MTIDKTAIRNAATVIVLRDGARDPHVLMGQRGAKAAFMPNKFVFPGGAVDPEDAQVPLARALPALCRERLMQDCETDLSDALAAAAIRELWEGNRPGPGPSGHVGRHRAARLAKLCRAWAGAVGRPAAIRISRDHAAGAGLGGSTPGSFWWMPRRSRVIWMISRPPAKN